MLGFLEKLTLRPEEIGPDVAPLRAAGLADEEIENAIHVCALFNLINRVGDSLGFEPADANGCKVSARMLLDKGYA
jgi:alkylhydroperoxidase family enzyme